MVSVKTFGAVGDGKTDDTAAFRQAFGTNSPRAIYIPNGTYLIRDQIRYGVDDQKKKKVCVIGESREGVVLKLADNTPGFEDPERPKVFFYTRHPDQHGEQNMHNYLYHLTIEIGRGNPGAIALNYHTNNTGAVKDVEVRASDPVEHPGLIGIACADWDVGPASIRYVSVDGFETGMSLTHVGNYVTLEHIAIRRCATGIEAGTVSIRDLLVEDSQTPIRTLAPAVVLDTELNGVGDAAIEAGDHPLLVRNLKTDGFAYAVESSAPRGNVALADVTFYASHPPVLNWDSPAGRSDPTLNLPVEVSPECPYPDSSDWVVMPAKGDISAPLQAAIDDGATDILIPGGAGMSITRTIHLRNQVRRVMGAGNCYVTFDTGDQPVFRLEDGGPDTVTLELIYSQYGSEMGAQYEQASPRTFVIRHGSGDYRTAPEGRGGRVFIESLVANLLEFRGVSAWARDIDTEIGGPVAAVVNEEGTLWVLGQKTEDYATKLKTVRGRTELLGGTYRQNWGLDDFERGGITEQNRPPLFVAEDADVTLTYHTWGPVEPFTVLVRETRFGETREVRRSEHGGTTPLFVGRRAESATSFD